MATDLIIDFRRDDERRTLYQALRRLRGRFRISITKYAKRRSDRQNRFYWPCFVKPLADFLREQGEAATENDAHEILKYRFLRRSFIDDKTGEVMDYTRSTTDLSTTEFNEYLDQCAAWLGDMFGFEFPDPSVYHEHDERT